jgi:hypothetical protein
MLWLEKEKKTNESPASKFKARISIASHALLNYTSRRNRAAHSEGVLYASEK